MVAAVVPNLLARRHAVVVVGELLHAAVVFVQDLRVGRIIHDDLAAGDHRLWVVGIFVVRRAENDILDVADVVDVLKVVVDFERVVVAGVFLVDVRRGLDGEGVPIHQTRRRLVLAEVGVAFPEIDEFRRRNDDDVRRVVVAKGGGAARVRRRGFRHFHGRVGDLERDGDFQGGGAVERFRRAVPLEGRDAEGDFPRLAHDADALGFDGGGGEHLVVDGQEVGELGGLADDRRGQDGKDVRALEVNGLPRRLVREREERPGVRHVDADAPAGEVGRAGRPVDGVDVVAHDADEIADALVADVAVPRGWKRPRNRLFGGGER